MIELDNLKNNLKNGIEDLATLEVASFTNEPGVSIDLSDAVDGNGNIVNKQVFQKIRNSLTSSVLVGYSRFEVEGDAMNYMNSELGEDKKHIVDGHNALVEGAQKTRKDFFDFIKKVFNI